MAERSRLVFLLALTMVAGLTASGAAATPKVVEGNKGWDCRTMGNAKCGPTASLGQLVGLIEGQPGWDCRTMGNGVCGTRPTSASTEELSSILVLPASTGTTERVSVSSSGEQANDHSSTGALDDQIAINRDGRFVAFSSRASNLVQGDTNGLMDIFVRDRLLGTTERVSVGPGGQQGNGPSRAPDISEDGRYVAFESDANNLSLDEIALSALDPIAGEATDDPLLDDFADTETLTDIFVRDRKSKVTERVSMNDLGSPADYYRDCEEFQTPTCDRGRNTDPSISADGRHVAFVSTATNLIFDPTEVTGLGLFDDNSEQSDIFVRDRLLRRTERVTPNNENGWDTTDPYISGSGRYVTYTSTDEETFSCFNPCIIVFDRSTGLAERADVAPSGEFHVGESGRSSISDTGRTLAFDSRPPFGPENPNLNTYVYARDLQMQQTMVASVNSADILGDEGGRVSAVSGDGLAVAFLSASTNLVDGDTNGVSDVFVRVL